MKAIRYTLILGLVAAAFNVIPASAQDADSTSLRTDVEYEFGHDLRFVAEIRSESPILRATVFYRTSTASTTHYAFAELTQSSPVLAEVHLDLASAGFQPFSVIDYWWQLDFSETESYTSPLQRFTYRDNRFAWQFLQDQSITVFWSSGDVGFGQTVADVARVSLETISTDLALPLPSELSIYVYPSQLELQGALALGGQDWIGGHAIPELGVLLLSLPTEDRAPLSLANSVPHEMTHLMLYQRMGDSYNNLPGWLNEGLAVMQQEYQEPAYELALSEALDNNRLLPLESLCAAFPYDREEALLAYAESHGFVRHLHDVYGIGAIVRLLDTYQEGASCTGGVQRVFNRSLDDLQEDWISSSVEGISAAGLSTIELGAYALLLLPAAVSLAVVLIRKKSTLEFEEDNHV